MIETVNDRAYVSLLPSNSRSEIRRRFVFVRRVPKSRATFAWRAIETDRRLIFERPSRSIISVVGIAERDLRDLEKCRVVVNYCGRGIFSRERSFSRDGFIRRNGIGKSDWRV